MGLSRSHGTLRWSSTCRDPDRVKVNVYLPDALWERMKRVGLNEAFSAVCQRALTEELDRIEFTEVLELWEP
jgi:post-segregation antitoxin (ccd killing protein)